MTDSVAFIETSGQPHHTWEIPDVTRTEIGEMAGRKHPDELDTVRQYVSWFLEEELPKIIISLDDTGDRPPGIGADPGTRDAANRDNELYDWEKKFRTHYPEVADKDIEDLQFGDVICLPALGRNKLDWEDDVAFLKTRLAGKANVVVIDTPEIGTPIDGTSTTHTFQTLAELVNSQISQLEKEGILRNGKKIIVGHSKGGLIAAHLAINHPDVVANLICLSTPFKPEGRPPATWMLPLLNNLDLMNIDRLFAYMEKTFGIGKGKINSMLEKASVQNCIDTYLEILNYNWDKLLEKFPKDIGFVATKGRNDGFLDAGGYEGSMVVPEATLIGFPDFTHEKPPVDYLFRIIVGEQKKMQSAKLQPQLAETS